MNDIKEIDIISKKLSDIIFNYREMIKRNERMIRISEEEYRDGNIDVSIYNNDVEYHKEQIKIIKSRIDEIFNALKMIGGAGEYIKSNKFNRFIYEIGDK